ncbi:MAG: GspE/PulE family protein, partial [Candidatus Gracilibacteria bacterium]|nr:GspE/PulE family protein [Candidatus Gracilibacteria bacterium]
MSELSLQDRQLLEILREGEFIEQQEADDIERNALKEGAKVSQTIVDLAIMPDDQVGILVADLENIPFVRISNFDIAKETLDLIPPNIAKENLIVPVQDEAGELTIATNNIHQKELFRFLEKKTRKNIRLYYAAKSDIKNVLRRYETPLGEKLAKAKKDIEKKGEKEGAEAISNLLNDIVYFAAQEHASDIHIEPQTEEVLVRARTDGILKDILFLPKSFQETITTRIKVLSNLRTDEHRAPQDGRIKMEFSDMSVTLRVSIIPIYDGEKIVLRLLASQSSLKLESLGYNETHLKLINEGMQKTHGMILVTGPTGCGKTTTLYSVLRILNKREINLSTIEDPVEIRLRGTNQIQVNNDAKLTFAAGLRSILRQDPDIILVGEIRDVETANIAVNSALTGHLVLATLHTNDAA